MRVLSLPTTIVMLASALIACGERKPAGTRSAETYGSPQRGLALLEHTPDSLPQYALANLRCTSCHLDRGLRAGAAPIAGATRRYPKLVERAGVVASIEDRINYCFTRSLAGNPLPTDGRDMADMVAYMASISRDVGADGRVAGQGMPAMPQLAGDSARGAPVFAESCARCHGVDGAGNPVVPALWGERSYSIGASMARVERAASFIRHNMPFDRPGTLTDQQSFDVAAFIDAHPRPDLPGKERDWPNGGAPADVPYATPGRTVARPAPVLPRRQRSISSSSRMLDTGAPPAGVTDSVSR
jgi:thiosulfate dehydrogenase